MSGLSSIPLTAILRYCEWLELDQRETDHMVRIIRRLDNRNRVLVSEKSSEKTKPAK